jgi:hypothetical protein
MGVIVTIPPEATKMYISVNKYQNPFSTFSQIQKQITCENCDVVLHKGSNFNSGDEMTDANAREWIEDMEPLWVKSDEICIACGLAISDDNTTLYTNFTNTKRYPNHTIANA